jgi:hypothetical protein
MQLRWAVLFFWRIKIYPAVKRMALKPFNEALMAGKS